MIKCEAGGRPKQHESCCTTIMNRVRCLWRISPENARAICAGFWNNRAVYLFMTTVYGEPNPQNVWNTPPEGIRYEVADWAMSETYFQVLPSAFGI